MVEIRIPGNEVRVGDVMRFRLSKRNPVRWLKVLAVTPGSFRVTVLLERGCTQLVSIRDESAWATVRREPA